MVSEFFLDEEGAVFEEAEGTFFQKSFADHKT